MSIHTQILVSLWNRRSVYMYMYMCVYPPTPADGKGERVREEITSSNCHFGPCFLFVQKATLGSATCRRPAPSVLRFAGTLFLMWRDVRFAGLAAAFWTFLLVRSESNVRQCHVPPAPSVLRWHAVLVWRDVRFAGLAAAFWTLLLVRSESKIWQ